MKQYPYSIVMALALLIIGAGCSLTTKPKTPTAPAVPVVRMEQGKNLATSTSEVVPDRDALVTFASTTLVRISEKTFQEPIDLDTVVPYTLTMSVVEQDWQNPRTTVSVRVPQMTNTTNPVQAVAFNDLINQKTDQITTEFLQQVADWSTDNIPVDEQTNFIEVAVFARMVNTKIISLVFEVNTFYAGSAHPNQYTRSLNYDLEKNTPLELADLFVPNKSFLNKFSQVVIATIKTTPNDHGEIIERDAKWLADGAGPNEMNFHTVTLSPKGMYVQFDPYDIDAYAVGKTEIFIPYEQLSGYVLPRVLTLVK